MTWLISPLIQREASFWKAVLGGTHVYGLLVNTVLFWCIRAMESINILRKGSLWGNAGFSKKKKVISHLTIWNEFETSADVELNHLKAHNMFDTGVFLPLFSRSFDEQLSSNLPRFVHLCICWGTPSKTNGFWQLPKVPNAYLWQLWCFVLRICGYFL